jgi:hypothetical protein
LLRPVGGEDEQDICILLQSIPIARNEIDILDLERNKNKVTTPACRKHKGGQAAERQPSGSTRS